ncbi:hypothetical protein [Sphingopyxis sp. 22461]|uniref:hypothetical protein n=1 Tax=Sphingopyxis sp. 22461 TaxID=3453923 RepID=UPI003F85225C
MLNPFQQLCAQSYGGGDFAHVESVPQARETGDTLFAFLMIELSESEGCKTREEAVRRLEMAISDIQCVIAAVDRKAAR